MKKIKWLMPMVTIATLSTAIAPLASCGNNATDEAKDLEYSKFNPSTILTDVEGNAVIEYRFKGASFTQDQISVKISNGKVATSNGDDVSLTHYFSVNGNVLTLHIRSKKLFREDTKITFDLEITTPNGLNKFKDVEVTVSGTVDIHDDYKSESKIVSAEYDSNDNLVVKLEAITELEEGNPKYEVSPKNFKVLKNGEELPEDWFKFDGKTQTLTISKKARSIKAKAVLKPGRREWKPVDVRFDGDKIKAEDKVLMVGDTVDSTKYPVIATFNDGSQDYDITKDVKYDLYYGNGNAYSKKAKENEFGDGYVVTEDDMLKNVYDRCKASSSDTFVHTYLWCKYRGVQLNINYATCYFNVFKDMLTKLEITNKKDVYYVRKIPTETIEKYVKANIGFKATFNASGEKTLTGTSSGMKLDSAMDTYVNTGFTSSDAGKHFDAVWTYTYVPDGLPAGTGSGSDQPFTHITKVVHDEFDCRNSFLADSWENLVSLLKQGGIQNVLNYYNISDISSLLGMKKTVKINGVSHEAMIIGVNHDNLTDGSGKASLTFALTGLLRNSSGNMTQQWNSTLNNQDFVNSSLNKALNSDEVITWNDSIQSTSVLKMIEDPDNGEPALASALKTVNKKVASGSDYHLEEYSAKIFPLTVKEMNITNGAAGATFRNDEGETYEITTPKWFYVGTNYWSASPRTNNITYGGYVNNQSDCKLDQQQVNSWLPVKFAFCI